MIESEPASFLTLNEKDRTVMSKLVKAMASLCSTYAMNFRALVQKHELEVEEDLSGKVPFVLADPPNNV